MQRARGWIGIGTWTSPVVIILALAAVFVITAQAADAPQLLLQGSAPSGDEAPWSPVANISDWYGMGEGTWLKVGQDGTQAAFWMELDSSTGKARGAIWANVRSPAGGWGDPENVTGWMDIPYLTNPLFWDGAVAPDGTVWMTNVISDSVEGFRVTAHWRPPGGAWQSEPLSGWEIMIRSVELDIGPDGDAAAAWVECDTISGNPADGSCMVQVRRRPARATGWGNIMWVNPDHTGVQHAYVNVGTGGTTVAVWNEASSPVSGMWRVMSRAYTSSGWEGFTSDLSGWIYPRVENAQWLAPPVMDVGGMMVVAWYAKTGTSSSYDAIYSNTDAGSGWNANPIKISGDYEADSLDTPLLAVRNGATAAAWQYYQTTPAQAAIYANMRDAGSTWGTEARISDWMDHVTLGDLEIWPGGTAMAIWEADNATGHGVFWSARIPSGSWGSGGSGQLGNWYTLTGGSALALGEDGSGAAIWGFVDGTQPVGKQCGIMAAIWPIGGPSWNQPEVLVEGYGSTHIWQDGVVVWPGGRTVGAAWWVQTPTSVSPTQYAVLYANWPDYRVYLPLVLRNP